jgi:hypothetical protein
MNGGPAVTSKRLDRAPGRRFRDDDDRDSISWHNVKRRPKQDGTSALVWGVGSFLIPFPFVPILAIYLAEQVLKRNPNDGMAKTGKVLATVSLVFVWLPASAFLIVVGLTYWKYGSGLD